MVMGSVISRTFPPLSRSTIPASMPGTGRPIDGRQTGIYWFVGRADDVIKSAGHLIGPFEVESALMEHAAVAEVGVIGIPDEAAGELVKAFVALKNGAEPSEALRKELLGHARKRLGPAVAPKAAIPQVAKIVTAAKAVLGRT